MAFYQKDEPTKDTGFVIDSFPQRSLPPRTQRTRRGYAQITGTTGHTEVSTTSFTVIPSLSFTMNCSGAPIRLGWSMMVIRNTATIIECLYYVDNQRMTSIAYEYTGIWQPVGGTYDIGVGLQPLASVTPGPHTFAVAARVDANIGLIATDTDWRAMIWAEELP